MMALCTRGMVAPPMMAMTRPAAPYLVSSPSPIRASP